MAANPSVDEAQQLVDAVNAVKDPEFVKQLAASGHTPEDYLAELHRSKPELDPTFTQKILAGLQSGLDYGRGLVRTPIMEAATALQGPEGRKIVSENAKQDWIDTAWPFDTRPAPSVDEWKKRQGIDTSNPPGALGAKVLNPLWQLWHLPEKMRGRAVPPTPGPNVYQTVEGLADAAMSPAGIASGVETGKLASDTLPLATKIKRLLSGKGALPGREFTKMSAQEAETLYRLKEAMAKRSSGVMANYVKPMAKAALDPLGFGLPMAASQLYKNQFAEADRLSRAAGHGDVSDVLSELGVTGTPATIYDKATQSGKDIGKSTKALVGEVADQYPNVVIPKVNLRRPVGDTVNELAREVGQTKAAHDASQGLADYINETFPGKTDFNLADIHQLKTGSQNLTRKSGGYGQGVVSPAKPTRATKYAVEADTQSQVYKRQADVARQAEEFLFDKLGGEGTGSTLHQQNRMTGALLAAQPALERNYRAAIPSADNLLRGPWSNITTSAKTGLGLAGSRYGRPVGNLLASILAETYNQPIRELSPWDLMEIQLMKERQNGQK